MRVYFPNQQKSVDVPDGATIAESCSLAGISINYDCGGKGNCGKCSVLVRKENLTMEVLACQYNAADNMRIYTDADTSAKILSASVTIKPLILDAPVIIYPVAKDALNDYPSSKWLEVLNRLLPKNISDPHDILARIAKVFTDHNFSVMNILTAENNIIDISLNDISAESLGMAFDIGTTTIAGYLYDLNDGTYLAHHAVLNGQKRFGADVLSRIAESDHGRQKELSQLLYRSINEIIANCEKKVHLPSSSIIHMVFAGNTTMLSFLMGLNPSSLGKYPFVSPVIGEQIFNCENLKANQSVHPRCVLRSLSPVGAFVGADTTALLTTIPLSKNPVLVIDLGTNGEIALGSEQFWTVCSAACGPAFEGGSLNMGMRAETGAVESVSYTDGQFVCSIIGKSPAKGICGSGIIDTIACLLELNLINVNGDFLPDNAINHHSEGFRIINTEVGKAFVLMTAAENPGGKELIITQKDIRTLQNALAAVKTAVFLLLKQMKTTWSDLENCYLAGGFGNYLNVSSAKILGLLPKDLPVKLLGNGSGNGALRCMLSRKELDLNRQIAKNTSVVSIADLPDFNHTLLRALSFESLC